jgi:hypothetical protein
MRTGKGNEMDAESLKTQLRLEIKKAGGVRSFARLCNLSDTHVYQCAQGYRKISPIGRLAAYLLGQEVKPRAHKTFENMGSAARKRGALAGSATLRARKALKRVSSPEPTRKLPGALKAADRQCACVRDGLYLRCQPDCPQHGLETQAW